MTYEKLYIESDKLPRQLSNDELNILFEKVKNGDHEVRKKIIEHNIRLVLYQVLNIFKTVEYDKNELVSVGIQGLTKAAITFDITKNIKFATYASRCIENEILMFLRKVNRITDEDSLDKVVFTGSDGNELTLGEMISCDINIEKSYTDMEVHLGINRIVNALPERDRGIIKMYFGFLDRRYTQHEISLKLNVSQRHVSGLITKAVNRIALELEKEGLIERSDSFKHKKSLKV